MSLSINWDHLQEPGAARTKANRALQSSAAGSSADLHHASRRGPQSLATGSGFRCYPRGNSESEVRPVGFVLPPAAVHPTGHLRRVGLKTSQVSVWLAGPTRVDGARSGEFCRGPVFLVNEEPTKDSSNKEHFLLLPPPLLLPPLPCNSVPD
jgi:hypothetical protein